MINVFPQLVARDGNSNAKSGGLSTPTVDLLISLLVLILLALTLVGSLLVLRRKRQLRKQQSVLPIHNGQCSSHQRQLTITAGKTDSVLVYDEKRNLMENSSSPTCSPLPEIRITFPEEVDESGKRKSGRVVVVRISDAGSVGLEPCREELPPYQATDAGRFHSLDIERMGGLKEKEDLKTYA